VKKRVTFTRERKKIFSLPVVGIAASFLIIAGSAAVILLKNGNVTEPATNSKNTVAVQEVLPGSDKAVLVLSDGRKIILDSTAPSALKDENITVENATLKYRGNGSETPSQNLLVVPRGGQYKLVLPDGTKVWLNAESSLSYPTAFTGAERKVQLTGEGYFEVTKNKEQPFIVESSGNSIKVLGTQFNINSYGDENAFTATLVEGSVQISRGNISKMMKPGEQAKVEDDKIDVMQVDTKEAIAWKEGEFVFRDAPVTSVVRQVCRWYDLEAEYRDPVDKHLNAVIKRNVPLAKVLHYLEETGAVHFKTENKKLVVMK
jgi:hypothetical protein